MTEAEYYDWVKAGCADEESFLQEYMCIAADDDAAFLEYDLIAAAEYQGDSDWTQCEGGELFGGVDIGRKQDLTVLWVLERLGDVLYTRHIECGSEERRVGKEWVSSCRSRWVTDH